MSDIPPLEGEECEFCGYRRAAEQVLSGRMSVPAPAKSITKGRKNTSNNKKKTDEEDETKKLF